MQPHLPVLLRELRGQFGSAAQRAVRHDDDSVSFKDVGLGAFGGVVGGRLAELAIRRGHTTVLGPSTQGDPSGDCDAGSERSVPCATVGSGLTAGDDLDDEGAGRDLLRYLRRRRLTSDPTRQRQGEGEAQQHGHHAVMSRPPAELYGYTGSYIRGESLY